MKRSSTTELAQLIRRFFEALQCRIFAPQICRHRCGTRPYCVRQAPVPALHAAHRGAFHASPERISPPSASGWALNLYVTMRYAPSDIDLERAAVSRVFPL